MRRLRGQRAGALLAAGLLMGAVWSAHPLRAAAQVPAATVQAPGGPFLTDPQGRRLMFHGINLVPECAIHSRPSTAAGSPCIPDPNAKAPGWYVTQTDPDPSRRFTDADAATLHGLGIDFVRLGIHWEALEPGAGVGANDPRYCRRLAPGQSHDQSLGDAVWNPAVADEYLRRVDDEVAILARHGIKILLDMHSGAVSQYFAKPDDPNTPWMGSGAPLWAVCTDGLDPSGVYPTAYPSAWNSAYFTPPVADAADHFWNNDVAANQQAEYIRSWVYVVSHYVHSPLISDIVGYELANEPVDFNQLASPTFDAKLQCDYVGSLKAPQSCAEGGTTAYAQPVGMIPAIQVVDSQRLIFYEPPILADEGFPPQEIGQQGEPMPFDNLVLSFHTYNPASEASPFNMEAMARAATKTGRNGDQTPAWFNTEFGASDVTSDIGSVVANSDQNLVSWTYWAALQLHDPTGAPTERLIEDNTRQLVFPKACVLAGAHVQAYAGTPTKQAYDPQTGVVTAVWTPDPAVTAPTLVNVPALRYGAGYRIDLQGGRVVSRPNTETLAIANTPGAHSVSLTITPTDSSCPPKPLSPGTPGANGSTRTSPLGLPTSACLSRRRLVVHIARALQQRLRSVALYINGHRRQVLRHRPWRVIINLRGTPHATVHVTILARTRTGRTLSETHTYHTCRPGRHHPRRRHRRARARRPS